MGLHTDPQEERRERERRARIQRTQSRKATTPRCPDCHVPAGTQHDDGCDVARCPWTGLQRLGCWYFNDRAVLEVDHECGHDVWTGRWPGDEDAERLGFWCLWDGPIPDHPGGVTVHRGRGWVRVPAATPDAQPDLNRLVLEGRWDRNTRKWVA